MTLIDDLKGPVISPSAGHSATKTGGKTNGHQFFNNPSSIVSNPLVNPYKTQVIELSSPTTDEEPQGVDPLTDEVYFKAHRRVERQEKQLRNIEKERAQHEKLQLERLLDELQGHDWLKVMGISGITDTEKKLYEPKRAYFIREVSALVDKFRVWKEEEKRRKAEKEQHLIEEIEASAAPDTVEDGEDQQSSQYKETYNEELDVEKAHDHGDVEMAESAQNISDDEISPDAPRWSDPPDINDVDAWAARQLHQEASLASRRKGSKQPGSSTSRKQSSQDNQPPVADDAHKPLQPPPPTEPFTSFFSKPHLRDAALGKNRRGRTRLAFGQPLPEIGEREFALPDDILTQEAIVACQRKKRRLRREQKN